MFFIRSYNQFKYKIMDLVNENLSINDYRFTIGENYYEISKTVPNEQIFNTMDTIINRTNGNTKTMRRADLVIMLKKYNAKSLVIKNKQLYLRNINNLKYKL